MQSCSLSCVRTVREIVRMACSGGALQSQPEPELEPKPGAVSTQAVAAMAAERQRSHLAEHSARCVVDLRSALGTRDEAPEQDKHSGSRGLTDTADSVLVRSKDGAASLPEGLREHLAWHLHRLTNSCAADEYLSAPAFRVLPRLAWDFIY